MDQKVTLGYWGIRGIAQPIRLLLEYSGINYEDKRYNAYNGTGRVDWAKDKESLGFAFPNLPYLIDGNTKLTQSHAIMRYIARKNNLLATTEEETIAMDIVEYEIEDFKNRFVDLCYNDDYEKLKEGYLKDFPRSLTRFEKFLGTKKWFAGEKLTFVDFLVYEQLDQHTVLESHCLDKFPNLTVFVKRFAELPKISSYLKSDKCIKRPCNNPSASGL